MKVYDNVLEMIGNTPLVKVNNIDTGPCDLYLKLELQNPGGSIKGTQGNGHNRTEDTNDGGRPQPGVGEICAGMI